MSVVQSLLPPQRHAAVGTYMPDVHTVDPNSVVGKYNPGFDQVYPAVGTYSGSGVGDAHTKNTSQRYNVVYNIKCNDTTPFTAGAGDILLLDTSSYQNGAYNVYRHGGETIVDPIASVDSLVPIVLFSTFSHKPNTHRHLPVTAIASGRTPVRMHTPNRPDTILEGDAVAVYINTQADAVTGLYKCSLVVTNTEQDDAYYAYIATIGTSCDTYIHRNPRGSQLAQINIR